MSRNIQQEQKLDRRLHTLKLLHPKRRFTREAIASFVGACPRTIAKIEQTALLKLRRGLRAAVGSRQFDEFLPGRSGLAA